MNKKLLFALMYSKDDDCVIAFSILKKEFGSVLKQGPDYDFTFTDYYKSEFGKNLKKTLVVFDKDISKDDLVKIRNRTGEIEEGLKRNGKRVVNIDPGYISSEELVLATKKFRSFKEDLGGGVYAHKVLEFKDGEVAEFQHTFADYKTDENKEFFKKIINELI